MSVSELRKMLKGIDGDVQVMVQARQLPGSAYLQATERAYLDTRGSRACVVLDLFGQEDSAGDRRIKLPVK